MSAGTTQDGNVRSPPTSGSLEYDSKQAPLDPTFYDVDVEFLSIMTGIKDPEELKKHVLQVQADAYAVCTTWLIFTTALYSNLVDNIRPYLQVYPYPCIRNFTITKYVI